VISSRQTRSGGANSHAGAGFGAAVGGGVSGQRENGRARRRSGGGERFAEFANDEMCPVLDPETGCAIFTMPGQ